LKEFGAESTTDEVLDGWSLAGQRMLVTGVSSGLGVETARALAMHGAEVVGTARNLRKGRSASGAVRAAAAANGVSFELVELDLASLASVRACADRLVAKGQPFDLVIANAGVMACPESRTAEGFELQIGTNHLGHFVLVNRIAPLIRSGGRLVVLSSAAHRFADVDLDDPGFERTPYDPWIAYGRSKTANALFAVEFDRRYLNRSVRAAVVHPGAIQTDLSRHLTPGLTEALMARMNESRTEGSEPPVTRYKTVEQGAATTVWAGVVADREMVGGRYCEDCQVAKPADAGAGGVRSYAIDAERAQALWAESEIWVGEHYEGWGRASIRLV
jgi:NAD(P)-dependent dehydrogenase (short-subunit alcohol dehydrogenase family)